MKSLRCLLVFLVSLTHAIAANYFIDYEGGNDQADGQSPATAWKHSPGDKNATGQPAAVKLQPGDVITFKGGVQYLGEIVPTFSGSEGKPITYDGNSAGNFGTGPAILDGATMIEGWQQVTSAEQVGGNSQWAKMMYADIDVDLSSNFNQGKFILHRDTNSERQAPWQRIFLIDGVTRVLPIAQMPKPSDPFYPDLPRDFYKSPVKVTHEGESSIIVDEENLTQPDPKLYEGMFVGLHGGNNHVYFARVESYNPDRHSLTVPKFGSKIYDKTSWAVYNAPVLIREPGEWCLEALPGGKTRVYLMPEKMENGQPVNIGYPVLQTAIGMKGDISYIDVKGFLMQRYAGGTGGVSTNRDGNKRPSHINIADCEVRFMSGQSGISLNYSDHITVENCYVHHCPGWTVGIYVNRINNYRLSNNRIDNNSGSGIRHYEAKHGVLENNYVINHYGMHSSGLNFYEGCADILFTGNYVENIIAINRSAENLTFRNNVVNSEDSNPVSIAMWGSGTVGGKFMKNLVFENNTLVNISDNVNYASSIFVQGGASAPTGMVIKNNVLERLRPPNPAQIEGNIFMRDTDSQVEGTGSKLVKSQDALFRDPENGDYRRKPGGPMMEAGADVPPPPATWSR